MPRGSAPGERRGGRVAGTPNKATADIKALAGVHAEQAITALADIMVNSDSDAAKVAAVKELLDRAFGKAKQSVDVDATLRIDWMQRAIQARSKANERGTV